jgi:hypothetical protein
VLALTDLVVTQLTAWRIRQRKEAFAQGKKPPKYVFANKAGSQRCQRGMWKVFNRVIVRCKIIGTVWVG